MMRMQRCLGLIVIESRYLGVDTVPTAQNLKLARLELLSRLELVEDCDSSAEELAPPSLATDYD
jgi:hypothetical protein